MHGIANGKLNDSAVETVQVAREFFPCTATLKSAAGGRKIELSTDGAEYFTPTYDQTTATMLVVSITSPVAYIKFTGAANDLYGVL